MDNVDVYALARIDLNHGLTPLAPCSALELSVEDAARPEGPCRAGIELLTAFPRAAPLAGSCSRVGSSVQRNTDNMSRSGSRSPFDNILKGFTGVQKKVTRGK